MKARGYDDERWWETEEGRRWRRGEGTAEGPKSDGRAFRKRIQHDFGPVRDWHREGRITSKQADDWETISKMSDAEFEALLSEWYPAGRQTQPKSWHDPAFNHPSQPVVGVCWYEVRAYCAWLSGQSRRTFRLPTGAEWEAAARRRSARKRAKEGRTYAWGDTFSETRCNTFESHVRGTTPIGVFPAGDTPEGLVDMTGNVWEWTGSAYRAYPYDPDDGREATEAGDVRRVVRGGSWLLNRHDARASYRGYVHPVNRHDDLGFRVVCVSPIR